MKVREILESKSMLKTPTFVSSNSDFKMLCDGKNFIFRKNGERFAKISHGDWQHIIDAVKNRVSGLAVADVILTAKGDSYILSSVSGDEQIELTASEMDKLIGDSKKYLNSKMYD